MMLQELDCSEANFYTWNQINCLQKKNRFKVYKAVAETMAGKKVIIRTLDIGADKKVDYLNLEAEENPAMGYRAIRIRPSAGTV